jgi:hypothetical protein
VRLKIVVLVMLLYFSANLQITLARLPSLLSQSGLKACASSFQGCLGPFFLRSRWRRMGRGVGAVGVEVAGRCVGT